MGQGQIPQWITFQGRTMNRRMWADEIGVSANTVRYWTEVKGMAFKEVYTQFKERLMGKPAIKTAMENETVCKEQFKARLVHQFERYQDKVRKAHTKAVRLQQMNNVRCADAKVELSNLRAVLIYIKNELEEVFDIDVTKGKK